MTGKDDDLPPDFLERIEPDEFSVPELIGLESPSRVVPCPSRRRLSGSRAREVVARGYRALKFDPFGTAWKDLTPEEAGFAVDLVAAVRDAVGTKVAVMIEFHGRLSAGSAVEMIRRLERFEPAWCEEPVAPESLDLLAEVRRQARCPIAAGERLYTLADHFRLTSLRAADVVQMDMAHCGGILAAKKIAAMASVQDLRVAPHCSIGPVALAACLHFDASTPNFMIREAFAEFDVPWQPVRRLVALKLIRLGMDSKDIVARFESERQALALMSHPGIARVYDAGMTPDGRPFFVMEHVPGEPITDYCDRQRLGIRAGS